MSEPCPACGTASASSFWRLAEATDRRAGKAAYPLLRCGDCGTAWVARPERPSDPSVLYAGGTYSRDSHAEVILGPLRRLSLRERTSALPVLPERARILEMGAGLGELTELLRTRGYRATGVDPYRPAAGVVRAPAESGVAEPDAYDAVVAWHVLEHLEEPAVALSEARNALRTEGWLVAATPNLDSLQARLGGSRWFHEDVPRHTTLFTTLGLRALLERCGFESVRFRHLGVQQHLLGMWQTLLNRVTRERDVVFRALKGVARPTPYDALVSLVAGFLALPVTLVLEPAAGLLHHGGAVVATARRRP